MPSATPLTAQSHTCSPRRAPSPFPAATPCCWGKDQSTVPLLEPGNRSQHLSKIYNPGGGAFEAGLRGGVVWVGLAARLGSLAL